MVLLVIIYMAFISLGLPDSILGSAWPTIHTEWGLPLDAAGYISFICVSGTIVSSFMSGRVIRRFGTAKVTLIACTMTGLSLLGYSFAPSYIWLLLLAVPLGLGGGSVDAALNNYVATHYEAHHMNWLHSFWGVGATAGPVIMSGYLLRSWQLGYRTISMIQLTLAVILFLTLRLWPKEQIQIADEHLEKGAFKVKGVKYALAVFLFYCMSEFSTGLWGATYLVKVKSLSPDTAARFIAIYYGGITLGRMVSGFLTFRLSNQQLIRYGTYLSIGAMALLMLPLPKFGLMIALLLIGFGLAPIFPAMIHETPNHFGKELSQTVIGYQVAFAGIGSAFLPPVIGLIVKHTSMWILPIILILGMVLVLICTGKVFKLKVS
ncbi:MFS transporter [Acidaminobacter sp. JC074]|uniref:MFS transporter n=1 Tax=Acidaminobacter sp. JC074 TaxID=2530199 RepID=UPI001F109E0A|nr:MFS transporter [Acidaminobacter sp. JC074]MCH4889249.1 MFS transporter [Acidaminobacter sp. JC074]